jgi:hypothetical protein
MKNIFFSGGDVRGSGSKAGIRRGPPEHHRRRRSRRNPALHRQTPAGLQGNPLSRPWSAMSNGR